MKARRVFLLDSHDIFRAGVRSVLDADPEMAVVGESGSFADGYQLILETGPDVALVGIREAEHERLADLAPLRTARPDVGVMVLSRNDGDQGLVAAMQIGARAHLSKDLSVEELTDAVDAVARGENILDHARAMRAVHEASRALNEPDPLALLTPQERKILTLLAVGLTNRQIADRLFLVEKTVRNHVTRILAKLGVERRTQAALLAAKRGLLDSYE